MLYQIKDGTVSAGGQTILSHVDFYIKEKEKIAVVGKNGAGKTTLLRLLAGELTPDRDDSRGSYGRSNDMVTGAATAGSTGNMRKSRIYNINELIKMAKNELKGGN